ncbi:Outer membrane lipoprotein-sorting protein [Luteitalea pratensis]|uniref:Outer membrane lipoprotein-sorting protein n=1 Tax=Luteitalea pratensis TaxID=1855912 RepID=A0A143PKH2_LUTPR|nr:DUF2092 domain-containing protein [Luteitalea pratensis]AMY09065.1 Outer membrane lipoprotein-sorting protein [Luteitalea pratensis]
MDTFLGSVRARTGVALAACLASLLVAGCSREPATPEAKKQRGDEIVKRMSDHLAQAKTFTVETADTRKRSRGGKEITVHTKRQVTVRRPDRLALRITGDMNLRGWYDGSKLTLVSDPQKVWARANAAATIDETLDRMADHLAMPVPLADFLYSSPYDALIGTKSTGGYVGSETVEGVACAHVAYKHPAVDWDLWVAETGDPVPRKFVITNKTATRARTTEVTFDKWTFGAEATDATFTPEVPAGYERIQIVVGAPTTPAPTATQAPTASGAPKQ